MNMQIDQRCLLTTYIIRCEYKMTHPQASQAEIDAFEASQFSFADLRLSLDDFSKKMGWMS